MTLELSILTLNVWGIPLPFVSSDREARIAAIGDALNSGTYDVVSLQEVWSQSDCQTLINKTKSLLPYSHYFYSGVIGAGLLVLSKYPIISAMFHAWSVNGYFHRIQHADWFGGKGVGLVRILIDDQVVHIYNAHLHAEYDNDNDEYKTHRVIQAFDTAQFIRATRGDSVLQVLAGDLNTQPQDLSYKVLLYISKMHDCCSKSKIIFTNECQRNSYTSKHALAKNPNGIRIDHIFVRGSENVRVSIVDCTLPLPDRVPGRKFSYSDHEAVLAKFKVTPATTLRISNERGVCSSSRSIVNVFYLNGDDSISANGTAAVVNTIDRLECPVDITDDPISRRITVLQEAIKLCESSLHQLKIDRILYYSVAVFLAFLLIAFVEYSVPRGFKTLYLLFKFVLFGVILFCVFMASVWNHMEHNGILSGKTSMEMMLRCVEMIELGLK